MGSATLAAGAPAADRVHGRARPRAATIAHALIAVAIVLRLATLLVPHFYFADEIFQYLEVAHRRLFGEGVVTWEQRYHIRSSAFPLALAGPMWLGATIAPGTTAYLLFPKLLLLALSLGSLWGAASLGRRISPLHGLLALFVAAIWFEGVYFSTQALTEAAAVPLFLAGAALAYRADRRSPITAGALLAASALLRFQYGPAILLFAVAATRFSYHRTAALACGAIAAVACSAAIDIAMGGVPFGWLVENFHQNIGLQRSHNWVSGPYFYLDAIRSLWGVWLVPLVALAVIGARRYPALALAAATNLLVHSMIAHKEYRYVLLTGAIVMLLAAIGTGDAVRWVRRRVPGARLPPLAAAAAIAWLLVSASIAFGPEVRLWWRQGTPMLQAFDALRRAPKLCGVALHGVGWSASGGYTYLHRAVPILAYDADQVRLLARESAAFDAIVAPATLAPPIGFKRTGCFADVPGSPAICISRRAGGCDATASSREINALLVRQDR